jgi:hypothetical protein
VHGEKPRWLHLNGHRSEGQRNPRAHDYNVKIKKMRAQIIDGKPTTEGQKHWIDPVKTKIDGR